MDLENYRKAQEEFVKNVNGTTLWEIYTIIIPSVFTVFISIIHFSIIVVFYNIRYDTVTQFCIEFGLLVLPMVLWVTILADYIHIVLVILLFVCITIIFIFKPLFDKKIDVSKTLIEEPRRHYITNIRTTISLFTAICILAVDFKIFPRRFAKTESFGYSLMDVGVGLFVYSNGIVTFAVEYETVYDKILSIYKSFISTIPLILLGLIRFFMVNELDYQKAVVEYGVHWNFFITLAVTKLISSVILICVKKMYVMYVSIIILFLHEYSLSCGLRDWVLSDVERNSFLTANREGISSALGYVGLFLLSTVVGTIMKIKINDCFAKNKNLAVSMLILSVGLFYVTILTKNTVGVSRRLANTGYCAWILFVGVSMSMLFLIVDLICRYIFIALTSYFRDHKIEVKMNYAPIIYNAINNNGLIFFLLANVLTGIVNLTIKTLYVNAVHSIFILITYIFINCALMVFLYVYNIKLKVW